MWQMYNPNPKGARVGDCSIRAISKAVEQDWIETYIGICIMGLAKADMPSSNAVWGEYLRERGFGKMIPEPGTTLKEFCIKYPNGIYVAALNGHVVTICDGDYFDTWDSGDETVLYCWRKETI